MAIGAMKYAQAKDLRINGTLASGKVFAHSEFKTGKGRISHRITVDFQPPPGNKVYRKEFIVRESIYRKAVEDGTVAVKYLPGNPVVSHVGDEMAGPVEQLVIGAGLLVVSLAIAIYLRVQWEKTRDYVLGKA